VRGISVGEPDEIKSVFPPIEDACPEFLSYAEGACALAVTEAYVRRMFADPHIAA